MFATGITIRPATLDDAAQIARVHVDSWRTTYRGIVPDEYLASLSYDQRQSRWTEWYLREGSETINIVAEREPGEMVGFACGSNNRDGDVPYTGELMAIYLLAEGQGKGTGRRLVTTVAEALRQRGHRDMVVWVLRDNPARGFYEALGGRLLRSKTVTIGGVQLEEVEYVWDDIGTLLR